MTTPVITQAMIDAYDEYTHLTLDRRGFMEKLTKLAGSGAAAATIAPLLAANPAAAEIVPADDARLKGEDITWPGSGGEMKGYLVRPADQNGKLPTVIVIHENRGLNAHIRDVARRVALEGLVALAPTISPLRTPATRDSRYLGTITWTAENTANEASKVVPFPPGGASRLWSPKKPFGNRDENPPS